MGTNRPQDILTGTQNSIMADNNVVVLHLAEGRLFVESKFVCRKQAIVKVDTFALVWSMSAAGRKAVERRDPLFVHFFVFLPELKSVVQLQLPNAPRTAGIQKTKHASTCKSICSTDGLLRGAFCSS